MRSRAARIIVAGGLGIALVAFDACTIHRSPANRPVQSERQQSILSAEDTRCSKICRSDRFSSSGSRPTRHRHRPRPFPDRRDAVEASARDIGSIAAVGFGLTGHVHRRRARLGPRRQRRVERARTTLRFFAERMPQEHGWFFHFVNLRTGAREWQSELSSIDTALLLAGVLTVRQCFDGDREIVRARRRHLPARRLHVDARRRSASAVARLEAGVGIPRSAVGSLLRADDPLPARRSDRRRTRSPRRPGAPGRGRR